MTDKTRYSGIAFTIGDRTITVAPLTFRQLRELAGKIEEGAGWAPGMKVDERLEGLLDVLLAAVNRNHPEIARTEWEEMIDLANVTPMFLAAMGRTVPGEAKAASA